MQNQSPGLSAAPAIAEEAVELIRHPLLENRLAETNFKAIVAKRKAELKIDEQSNCAAKIPLYGRIVCRCETVTEGEIVDAIHETCGAKTLDGVKRRTRAGNGTLSRRLWWT